MIRNFCSTTALLFCFFIPALVSYAGELVIYEPPPYIDATPEFELEVNGKKVFVYTSRVAAFASFSFSRG